MRCEIRVPPEWQLLTECLRCAVHDAPPPAEIAQAEWGALLRQARGHCVEFFLYPWLCRHLPAQFAVHSAIDPQSAEAAWRSLAFEYLRDTTLRREQTAQILRAFAAADIEVIPLKGTWLAETLYREPSQRHMVDIDLLVHPNDAEQARRILTDAGYSSSGSTADNSYCCDIKLFHPQSRFFVELHWNVHSAMTDALAIPDIAPVWERSVASALHGSPVRELPIEDLLTHLVQHILHHQFALSLKSYIDIALLLTGAGGAADPQRVARAAADWKTGGALPFVLAMVSRLFAVPLPQKLELCAAAQDDALIQSAWSAVFTLPQAATRTREYSLLQLREASPVGKFTLILGRIFMPQSYMVLRYPYARSALLLPFAWLARAVTLTRQSAGSVLRNTPGQDAFANAALRRDLIRRLLDEPLAACGARSARCKDIGSQRENH